VGESTFFYAE